MPIKDELVQFLHEFHDLKVPALKAAGYKLTQLNARESYAALNYIMLKEKLEVAQVYDELVPSPEYFVPVRIYNPNPEEALPVLMHFHGGGFVAGGVAVYDPVCRKLAMRTNHIVVSVDYRLAPENPYPCPFIDCYNATKNVWTALDARKIKYTKELSMTGDSAGGAICAYISERAQFDVSLNIKSQVLLYPCVDFTLQSESIERYGDRHFLTFEKLSFYYDCLFRNNENRYDASPLFGKFTKNLPATLVITAGFDPLVDEGKQYAEKAKLAGAISEYICVENMIHPFMNLEALTKEECEFVYAKMNTFLNKVW